MVQENLSHSAPIPETTRPIPASTRRQSGKPARRPSIASVVFAVFGVFGASAGATALTALA